MTISDIEDNDKLVFVNIQYTKINMQWCFTVTNILDEEINFKQFFKKYIAMRLVQVNNRHLFFKYRNGKM